MTSRAGTLFLNTKITRSLRLVGFSVITVLYLLWPNARPDFTRFNAHDSESYLALAYGLVNGLGYTRNMIPEAYIPHTTWPPGLPAILAPAVAISGDTIDWLAVKFTIIAIALCGVVLTWFLIHRLTGQPRVADAAALFVGLNPYYWHFARIAMAEVPLIVFCLAIFYLVDRIWARREVQVSQSMLVGVIAGLGMLLKGHAAGLVLLPLAYAFGPRKSILPVPTQILRWGVYALAFCVPFGVWSIRNHLIDVENIGFDGINQVRMILAADPTDPDSPLRTAGEVLANSWDNLRWFVIYRIPEQILPGVWAANLSIRPWGPYASLALSLFVTFLVWPRDARTLSLYFMALPMVLINFVLVQGGSERYWIPPMLLIGLAGLTQWAEVLRKSRISVRFRRLTVCALLALMLFSLGAYIRDFSAHPYNAKGPWKELAQLFEAVHQSEYRVIAVATPNSAAFSLITGLPAPITLASLGVIPRYSHIVAKTDQLESLLPGTEVLIVVEPWVFAKLPMHLTRDEILNRK